MEQHSFNKKIKGVPYLTCSKCGLVKLNNPFTKWCISKGCDYQDHPEYNNQRKTCMRNSKNG